MSGKIILNLAMSLDGYIADEAGGFAWITGQGDKTLDTPQREEYAKFLEGIDIVVMGRKSYAQGFAKDLPAKTIYVATHNEKPAEGNVHFITGDIIGRVLAEKANGKTIYLYGGGILVDSFIKQAIIDEYIIGIIPIILGKGRPLFLGSNPTIPLRVTSYSLEDGIAIFHYVPRKAQPPQ